MGYENEQILEGLPWARGFARACAAKLPSHLDRDDLQSAGVLGYLRAASRYDRNRGASFRGFCAMRIRGAVLDELRRWDWAPRSVHRTNRGIASVTHSLSEHLDREPTEIEVAEALGVEVTAFAVFQSLARTRQMVSFDEMGETGQGEESFTWAERLADPQTTPPDAAVMSAEDQGTLRKCLQSLPKTLATVLVLHYLQHVPLREVARMLTVTPSRVSQLHHEALRRLRLAWRKWQNTP
jgi:RNA polymerase sigma factor for flagellar operon FliA